MKIKIMNKNLDLIICQSKDENFLFYNKHYSDSFIITNLGDPKLDELITKSKGALFISSGANLDIFNFSSRELSDSLKIYRFENDWYFHKSDICIYPHQNKDDCADFAINSGCFYLSQSDCANVTSNILQVGEKVTKSHIEAFNERPFAPSEYKNAIFLDRDGILNVDTGYTFELDKLELVQGAVAFLKKASMKFQNLLVVTNQAGVAKGFYGEEEVLKFNNKLQKIYKENAVGLTSFEYCPYHFEGVVGKYKKHSFLRKPHTGMVLKHLFKNPISLKDSIMVGDRESDILSEPLINYFILDSHYLTKNSKFRVYKNFEEIEKSLFLS